MKCKTSNHLNYGLYIVIQGTKTIHKQQLLFLSSCTSFPLLPIHKEKTNRILLLRKTHVFIAEIIHMAKS